MKPLWLTNNVVVEICTYMNRNQGDSLLLIANKQTGFETAIQAELVGFNEFEAYLNTDLGKVTVAWSAPLVGRGQIRDELVSLAF